MTNPHNINQPIDFNTPTQTSVAEAEAQGTSPGTFKLAGHEFPLAESVSFVRAANIQKALTNVDLELLGEELPSIVQEPYREKLAEVLLADHPSSHPEHITMTDVFEAFNNAQEVLGARPTRK